MRRTLVVLAVVATVALGLTVLPAAAATDGDVTVEQADDGTATVTATENGSAVANATVIVESTDENTSYAGEGEYVTDENGTVDLPAPATGVNVSITVVYGNDSSSVASTYLAPTDGDDEDDAETDEDDSFGQLVSQFVQEARNDSDGGVGPAVATFVLNNNPASEMIPDHAGPPDGVGPGSAGPPDRAGDDGNASAPGNGFRPVDVGPPDDAGPPADRGDEDGGGPPDHAGPAEE